MRYNLVLEPNTNGREIWAIVGLETWVISYEFKLWGLRYEFWDMAYEQFKHQLSDSKKYNIKILLFWQEAHSIYA